MPGLFWKKFIFYEKEEEIILKMHCRTMALRVPRNSACRNNRFVININYKICCTSSRTWSICNRLQSDLQ
jgi:hypothetical protein